MLGLGQGESWWKDRRGPVGGREEERGGRLPQLIVSPRESPEET